jgi:ubiquinone/menaquinone biosynthesis C-methylase UbiE
MDPVKELNEDLWEQLPARLDPPLVAEREAFLRRHLRVGDRLLDLGCGEGDFAAAAAAAGAEVVGADVAQAALERAGRRHPDLRLELVPPHGPLPWDDGAFDVVWASEVVEHVADTARWLSEVRRVLTPGGRLLVTTPDHGLARRLALAVRGFEAHFDPVGDHLRFYTRRSLRALLDDFGFGEVRIEHTRGTLLASARR